MNNHGGIIIGINQYQFFQPLSYAKQDAQVLENFLVEEAGFSPDRCVVLSETSPTVDGHSTYPTRENLLWAIDHLCRYQLQPGDTVWFFFCGYGVSWQGEDYLMPIEGNSDDIPGTGIAMRSLYTTLKSSPAEKVLVLLDINRATGTNAGEAIGAHTVELARELEIPTVLSCQHSQFSRETAALAHGFFTAALLEGLRSQGCKTLDSLERYLSDRVPELSEQHFRPRQDPLTVVNPPAKINQVILPQKSEIPGAEYWGIPVPVSQEKTEKNAQKSPNKEEDLLAAPVGFSQTNQSGLLSGGETNGYANSALTPELPLPISTNGKSAPDLSTPFPPIPAPIPSSETNPLSPSDSEPPATEETKNKGKWVGNMALAVLAAGLVALLLLLGAIIREGFKDAEPKLANQQAAPSAGKSPTSEPVKSFATDNRTSPTSQPNLGDEKPSAAKLSLAPVASPTPAAAASKSAPTASPTPAAAASKSAPTASPTPAAATSKPAPAVSSTPAATSKPAPVANFQQSENATVAAPTKAVQQNATQGQLDKSLVWLQASQASRFSQAIADARKISPSDPLYEKAQENIDRWSEVIMDIAISRAQQGNFPDAIAAVKQVPKDRPALYAEAQKLSASWQKQYQQVQADRRLLQKAEALIRRGQASSYNSAIALADQIQPGQPLYPDARAAINNWSQNIWQIAQYRASRQRFAAAIEAAALIPPNTIAYADAQKALKRWQGQ